MHARECVRLLLLIAAIPTTLAALAVLPFLFGAIVALGSGSPDAQDALEMGLRLVLALLPVSIAGLLWFGIWRLRPTRPRETEIRPSA